MAVKRPNAGIVGLELQGNMSARSQHLRVSTLWILGIYYCCAVPSTVAFMKDLEIMPMHVEWLWVVSGCGVPMSVFGNLKTLRGKYLLRPIAHFAK